MRSKFFALLSLAASLSALRLFALPTLQLDVSDGVYNLGTETTVATTPQFELRALLNDTLNTSAKYYISAAIIAPSGGSQANFGSFSFGGVNFVLSDLTYGIPPSDVPDVSPSGNLAKHDVFPTYYKEFQFSFTGLNTIAAYNTQDGSSGPGSLYYEDFAVDVTGLTAGYVVHFDLYDEQYKNGKWKVDDFAPFSHDAESGGRQVPDGGSTLMLFGMGFVALAAIGFGRNRLSLARVENRR